MDKKEEDEKDDEKDEIADAKKAKALRCRDQALLELVETEKTYVNGLGKLIIIYMNPLKQNNYRIISISDHQTIFPSVVSTIYNLHNQLLAELDYNYHHNNDSKESITIRIGKVLIKYAELFKMYQIYMNGYERACKALQIIKKKNKKFTKWLNSQSVKTSLSAGDLESLLILPIQRIPRYQLLLKEIIKQTEKICLQHKDLDDLRNAYKQILEITKLIEVKMKEYDNKKKVALIEKKFSNINAGDLVTPSRYYITESKPKNIKIHNQDGSSQDIILILFNDCIIYGHFNEEDFVGALSSRAKLFLDYKLIFDNLFKCQIEDNYKNLYCLKVLSRQYSIWLSFKSKKLRTKWLKSINDANDLVNNKYLKNLQRFNNSRKGNFINIAQTTNKKGVNDEQTMPYPCFIPDDYANNCQQCDIKFTFTNRKHHCRQCGRLLCKTCTNYRINSVFFNKSKKNQIIRCCKKCKDNNTFNILNKPKKPEKKKKRVKFASNIRYSSNNHHNDDSLNNINPMSEDECKIFDHGYAKHQEIYNRIGRTKSSPNIKSPGLKSLKAPDIKHRASTPLLLNSSCTTTIAMQPKSPALKALKTPKIKSIKPQSSSRRKRKMTGKDIIHEDIVDKVSKTPMTISIQNMKQKYNDKMPQSPHLNPPKDHGYNNDDSLDDEIDEDDKSISFDIDDIDIETDMPTLNLSSKSVGFNDDNNNNGYHRRHAVSAIIPPSNPPPQIPSKEIKILNKSSHINNSGAPKSRRTRSYAVGLLTECNLNYVGCVITDDEATTDGDSNYYNDMSGQSLVDQLILSTSGASAPSSGDSNTKESPFTKKTKIRRVSFRIGNNNNKDNKKKYGRGRNNTHTISKSLGDVLNGTYV